MAYTKGTPLLEQPEEAEFVPKQNTFRGAQTHQDDQDDQTRSVNRILDWAAREIDAAADGEKHNTLNKVAFTLGGHVGWGTITEEDAYDICVTAISNRPTVADFSKAENTVRAAIKEGAKKKLSPDQPGYSPTFKVNGQKQSATNDRYSKAKEYGNSGQSKTNDGSDKEKLAALLKEATIDLSIDIPPPVVCLEAKEIGKSFILTTLGDFSLVKGQKKSRKTFFVVWVLATMIKRGTVRDRLRGVLPFDQPIVMFFDTEQGKPRAARAGKRALRLAGLDEASHFIVVDLRKNDTKERLEIIEHALYNTPGLGFVVIDGMRDLIFSINDEEQATMINSKFMKWSADLNIHIMVVLHENKGNSDPRGHAGTEAQNKAQITFTVKKDPQNKDYSIVETDSAREIEFNPIAFGIDENGLPFPVEGWEKQENPNTRKKTPTPGEITPEVHKEVLASVFNDIPNPKYSQLQESIILEFAKRKIAFGNSAGSKFITHYLKEKFIVQEGIAGTTNSRYKPT